MRTIIMGTVYDTDRADVLLYEEWRTHHPNIGGGEPTCKHKRGVYRGKNGGLFAFKLDQIGYGRDRNGVSGAFVRTEQEIEALDGPLMALVWCEHQDCFDVSDIERHFGDVIE